MGIREVLAAVGETKRTSNGYLAKCLAHEDSTASLTIGRGADGRVLLKCMAGCDVASVLAAANLTMADLFEAKPAEAPTPVKPALVATYDYRDENGTVLYRKLRYQPKGFRQTLPDGSWSLGNVRRVLYRLPELCASPSASCFVVEGERDCDNLTAIGLVATTNSDGAGKWLPGYSESLRGRRVVIIPDNDVPGEKHAATVAGALAGIAESVVVLRLPGLPPKGDVSDWLAAGGTKEQLEALVAKARPPMTGFQLSSKRLHGEREERVERGTKQISFGVKFLDNAFGGIQPHDLVLVGAKTGVGKTSLVTDIARYNCTMGRRVHYFALEAENLEIERRMKYRLIADAYYSSQGRGAEKIRFLDWMRGNLDQLLGRYEADADRKLALICGRMKTFYKFGDFTSADFIREYAAMSEETDLVILDHLHYVDSDEKDENRAFKMAVKAIRDSALKYGKPVICVAHVRKGDRRNEQVVPGIEDFHGSSDIAKIATKAIMIAPALDIPAPQPHIWPTFVQAVKCRLDGSLTRYAALTMFDARRDTYEDGYQIGRLTDGGRTFSPLSADQTPAWADAIPAYQGGNDDE